MFDYECWNGRMEKYRVSSSMQGKEGITGKTAKASEKNEETIRK